MRLEPSGGGGDHTTKERRLFHHVKHSSSADMSSSKTPNENETPKERNPGLRAARTTTLFRAVNPELFIKPNKPVMAFGLVAITLCVAYLGYLHATVENKKDLYEAVDSEGSSFSYLH
uniref:Small integral membrane protein 8 n=1 Tax=Phasianus colchicus TaxID=9054 RepID=A0A669QGP6_PHACC